MLCASLAPCTIWVHGKTATTLTTVSSKYKTSRSSTRVQFITAFVWYRHIYVNFSSVRLHFLLLSLQLPEALSLCISGTLLENISHYISWYTLKNTYYKEYCYGCEIWKPGLPLTYMTYAIIISTAKNQYFLR